MTGIRNENLSVLIPVEGQTGNAEAVDRYGRTMVVTGTSALPTTPKFSQLKISSTGTAVQLPSNPLLQGVVIIAGKNNASDIVIGDSSVTNVSDGTGNGAILVAGAGLGFAVDNTNRLYINGTTNDFIYFAGS